jgi:hypothetical protein
MILSSRDVARIFAFNMSTFVDLGNVGHTFFARRFRRKRGVTV